MAFPSCCICDTVGADVGINVGADVEEDIDHYSIAQNDYSGPHYHISALIR